MNNFTPAQLKVIQTWTEQRDSLHRDIGVASTELEALTKSTTDKGLALADLHQSIAEARGRIAELDALETRMRTSLTSDVAELDVRKSRLQGECSILEERLKAAANKYDIITAAIIQLEDAHQTMRDQAATVNSVVGEIIHTSQVHTADMKVMMDGIKTTSDTVIDRGNENVKQTNIVLEKMPRFIFDMQKPIPVRRTYPVGHPRYEAPKTE